MIQIQNSNKNDEYHILEKSITMTEHIPKMCFGDYKLCSKVCCPLTGKRGFIKHLEHEEVKVWALNQDLFINYFGRHNIENKTL